MCGTTRDKPVVKRAAAVNTAAMKTADIAHRFRIDSPDKFHLRDHDPASTGGLANNKDVFKEMLEADAKRLGKLQERLYAEGRWAVLIILQGMDASGKDTIIQHVMAGVNLQGCEVRSFKQPSAGELAHDFLWRTTLRLPERGHIGIFNRSYYEEVLVVRVHPEYLGGQKLPPSLVTDNIWKERFEDIIAFEKHLARNGTLVLKFFLHMSQAEQSKQMLERLEDPEKHWKFNSGDLKERALWDKYMAAYEDAIRNTSTKDAPWYVVPADNKWFARLVVAAAVTDAIEKLNPQFPPLSSKDMAALGELKKALKG
jgi:PPK2 family polyphosphate:nucleotide phosphotransferase